MQNVVNRDVFGGPINENKKKKEFFNYEVILGIEGIDKINASIFLKSYTFNQENKKSFPIIGRTIFANVSNRIRQVQQFSKDSFAVQNCIKDFETEALWFACNLFFSQTKKRFQTNTYKKDMSNAYTMFNDVRYYEQVLPDEIEKVEEYLNTNVAKSSLVALIRKLESFEESVDILIDFINQDQAFFNQNRTEYKDHSGSRG